MEARAGRASSGQQDSSPRGVESARSKEGPNPGTPPAWAAHRDGTQAPGTRRGPVLHH